MRVWKNERGLTLTELMAAVVIFGLVAVPLTSLGTTVLKQYQEDQQLNQAVLLAESKMMLAKMEVESTGELAADGDKQTEGSMTWTESVPEDEFQPVPELKQIQIIVMYPLTPGSDQTGTHKLTAYARVRP